MTGTVSKSKNGVLTIEAHVCETSDGDLLIYFSERRYRSFMSLLESSSMAPLRSLTYAQESQVSGNFDPKDKSRLLAAQQS